MDDQAATGLASTVDHLCVRVDGAAVSRSPFSYVVVDDALPQQLFDRLVNNLPDPDALVRVSETGWSSVARYQRHRTTRVADLPSDCDAAAWAEAESALTAPDVQAAILTALAGPANGTRQPPLRKEVWLDCALAGAHLEPHTDSPIQLMKVLIYLSSAAPDPSADTLLYAPRDPKARLRRLPGAGDYTDDNYQHESLADHIEVGRVSFRPNRMFAFLRSRNSLHGLAPLAPEAGPRYLLAGHFRHMRGPQPPRQRS